MENKIVLVSGAGSIGPGWGNGKACSVLYAREGAKVIACDINLDAAIETTDIIRKEGGNAIALQCDVSNQTSISKLFKEQVFLLEKLKKFKNCNCFYRNSTIDRFNILN